MGCGTRLLLILLLGLLLLVLLVVWPHPSAGSGVPAAPVVAVSSAAPFSAASSIRGRPSLSAAFITRVLAAYHSLAVGLGQAMYQDSVHFGIDDAVALAFFLHESAFGTTGVARVTHSVGNIICTPGWPRCVGRFRWYSSWAAGCLDWFLLLSRDYLPRGLDTLAAIVPVYAPSSDGNDVAGYCVAVVQAVRTWRVGRLEVS